MIGGIKVNKDRQRHLEMSDIQNSHQQWFVFSFWLQYDYCHNHGYNDDDDDYDVIKVMMMTERSNLHSHLDFLHPLSSRAVSSGAHSVGFILLVFLARLYCSYQSLAGIRGGGKVLHVCTQLPLTRHGWDGGGGGTGTFGHLNSLFCTAEFHQKTPGSQNYKSCQKEQTHI